MPPPQWKQEEEEGKANHRQTLNSLTPSRLQTAPLAFPSGTTGLLLPFPCFSNSQTSPSLPGGSSLPKRSQSSHRNNSPSSQSTFPKHCQSTPVLPHHSHPSSGTKPPYTTHLWGHRLLQPLCSFPGCSPVPGRSLWVGNTPLGSHVLETSTDTQHPLLGPKALC